MKIIPICYARVRVSNSATQLVFTVYFSSRGPNYAKRS